MIRILFVQETLSMAKKSKLGFKKIMLFMQKNASLDKQSFVIGILLGKGQKSCLVSIVMLATPCTYFHQKFL